MRELLKGNVRLVISYWVYGMIPAIIYKGLGRLIEKNYFQLVILPYIDWLFYLYLLFPFIYFPLIYVAIWRSSNKYNGLKLWRWLAKIAVILGVVLLIANAVLLFNLFFNTSLSDKIKIEVAQIQNSLPSKIDSDVEIYAISYDNNTITYSYRLLNVDKADIDLDDFKASIKSELVKEVCKDNDLKDYIKQSLTFSGVYVDKKSVELGRASVKPGDCK